MNYLDFSSKDTTRIFYKMKIKSYFCLDTLIRLGSYIYTCPVYLKFCWQIISFCWFSHRVSSLSIGYYDSDETLIQVGGDYYGSLYRPNYRGTRGGNGLVRESGKGGGYLDLAISSHLLVDGTMDVGGSHAKTDGSGNTDGAGGSGGTIYIR